MMSTRAIATTLKAVCGWCGLLIRDGREPVSHGLCVECLERELKELGRMESSRADRAYWAQVEEGESC